MNNLVTNLKVFVNSRIMLIRLAKNMHDLIGRTIELYLLYWHFYFAHYTIVFLKTISRRMHLILLACLIFRVYDQKIICVQILYIVLFLP